MYATAKQRELRPAIGYRLALGIFIAAICAVDVLWIQTNVAPPRMYDDAVYLADSVHLFQTLQERGLVPFLWESAEATKGHPPMIKILPVPFYFVFGPGTAAALYAYTLLIAIFCIYLFLLARELFHSDKIALIAVVMSVAFPLTYGMWRNVMAEFGTCVAVTACLYHLVRSDGFRNRKHVLLSGLFFGWGLLWKISFPVFILGPIAYIVIRRAQNRFRGLVLFGAAVLLVAGPFYAIGGIEVIRFARLAARLTEYTELWSLGPVFSPKTVMLYWLSIVNFGLSPYLFGVLMLLLVLNFKRVKAGSCEGDVSWFLGLWLVPPLLFFTFQVLKEIRHLLPALPVIGIAGAVLLVNALQGLSRPLRIALLAVLCVYPAYQFIALSFDTPYAPRKDVRWGPFILSTGNLELASLQLIPTYTFPANLTAWPTREVVSAIASHAALMQGRPPRVRVVGEHPYLSGLVLKYQSVLSRTPIASHGPFTTEDPASSDFSSRCLRAGGEVWSFGQTGASGGGLSGGSPERLSRDRTGSSTDAVRCGDLPKWPGGPVIQGWCRIGCASLG